MDHPSEAVGEGNAEGIEQQFGDNTTATGNGKDGLVERNLYIF